MHKKNDDHFHEDVKVRLVISNGGGDKSDDHAVKDKETFYEDMLYAAKDGWLYHDDIRLVPK